MYEAGDLIDIWVVERALGSGGMGSVYRCHNKDAKRIRAAIKVLDSMLSRDERLRKRFINEAVILYDLDHPNIVRVKNVRTNTVPPYLEMEFVEGESLDDRLRRGKLSFGEALDVMRQSADALAYLHARKVCHRDIKPANILIKPDGSVKLVDFGLAVEVDRTRITEKGVSFGTVSYAPPEWVAPESLDPRRWDIYALGVVFWECLTGNVAFPVSGHGSAKQQAMQVMVGKQKHPPLDPGPGFHDDLRKLIHEMTASDPDQRMADARALAERAHLLVPAMRHGPGITLTVPTGAPPETLPADTWRGDARDTQPPTVTIQEFGSAPSAARTMVPIAMGVGAVGLFGLVGLGIALLVALAMNTGPTASDVTVAMIGLPPEVPAHVRLDDRGPDAVDGLRSTFLQVEPGPVELVWTAGCDPCTGDGCAPWCGHGTAEAEVMPGKAEQVLTLDLPSVPVHVVTVALPGETPPEVAELGGVAGRWSDGTLTFTVGPGKHALVVGRGACALDCITDGCGDDCAVATDTVAVPWTGEPPTRRLELVAPEPADAEPDEPVAAAVAPSPPPRRRPTPAGSGLVTNSQFAAWLASHPAWTAQAAVDAGRADPGYLEHFSDGQPPADEGGTPVNNVSWYAAAEYCRGRGGLAAVDASPESWNEGRGVPSFEWRSADGRPAWRDAGGEVAVGNFRATMVGPLFGFRCR